MKFKFKTQEERAEIATTWTKCFAWWPVHVGNNVMIWLENVERRINGWDSFGCPKYEYREIIK